MHRYIDAEKLLDQFLELCGGKSCLDCQFFEHGCNLELMILNQPTADVEPVRHGRWDIKIIADACGYTHAYYECSVCGNPQNWEALDEFNYCPNCGARMDGDSD